MERAPTTQLNLILKGLLFTDDQEMARAIISIGKKKGDKLYAVGDKLESGNATRPGTSAIGFNPAASSDTECRRQTAQPA